MISGTVSDILEPRCSLTLQGPTGTSYTVDGVVDTGFNGFLTLSPPLIAMLQLPVLYRQRGMLADGTMHTFDVHEAAVQWNGQLRAIEVEAVDNDPLIGLELLRRHKLTIEVVEGGRITIVPMP